MKNNKLYDEIRSWKQTEMQLRDKKAHSFAMLFKDNPLDLGKLAFNLLAGNLRFVVPDKHQSNKSRWKTCQFWKRFLGAVEPLKLHTVTPDNTLVETQKRLKDVAYYRVLRRSISLNSMKHWATWNVWTICWQKSDTAQHSVVR